MPYSGPLAYVPNSQQLDLVCFVLEETGILTESASGLHCARCLVACSFMGTLLPMKNLTLSQLFLTISKGF